TTRAAFRASRERAASERAETDDWRMAEIDAEDARIALAEAKTEWDAEDAREALTQAEAHQAAHKADMAAAEAEYAEWFSEERRAKVWWAIDVVFGAVSKPGGDSGEEKA
ncbi:MAG: hypothetical protein KA329_05425, partial [Novosphingobium sp.]|nr:hypothetical protein [Novosphingobium sp.]